MKAALISAALPPALDGIGDYTANLAAELARSQRVTVLSGMERPAQIPGIETVCAFRPGAPWSVGELVGHVVRAAPDWVALEYCPFSYGRWGLNPFLPLAMHRMKRAAPRVRIALTVHEPMAWPINWKLRTMNLWQGPQLRALTRAADIVTTVVGKWSEQYRAWFSGRPVHHLPVGSNIPRLAVGRDDARASLGIAEQTVVLGVFGQGHHSQLWDLAAVAARRVRDAGHNVLVLHLGPASDRIRSLFAGLDVRSDGFLGANEVSRRLPAVDLFLAPFADGVSTRRGTLMAALQHGLAVVGTRGEATDAVLYDADGHALILTRSGQAGAFCDAVEQLADDPDRRAALAHGAVRLHDANFGWPVIARKMMAVLQGANPRCISRTGM